MGLLGMVKPAVDPSNAIYHYPDMVRLRGVYYSADPDWLYRRPQFGGNPYLGATLGAF